MAQSGGGRLPAAKNLADILDSGSGGPFRGRRFCGQQRRIPLHENVLPDVLPCFNFRRFRAHMGRFFSGRTSETGRGEPSPGNPLGTFGPLCSRLPGLDPHTIRRAALPGRISQISRSRPIQGKFGFWQISGENRLRLRFPVPATAFFLQQLFDAASCPAGPSPGGILDPVASVIVPLSALTCVPELASEPLGSIVQSTAQELFRSGRRSLLQALFAGLLLFDFIDLHSPPGREKGPHLRPFSA